jgi:hypothetical protein
MGAPGARDDGAEGAGEPLMMPAADGFPGGPWVNWPQASDEAKHDSITNTMNPSNMFFVIFILLRVIFV